MSTPERGPILYVEDNADHAELVLRSLERSVPRDRVVHVTDGERALAYLAACGAAQAARPAFVLLDLRLPRVDGIEVLREIKSRPDLRDIPVVVLTTSTREADVVTAYAEHANSYLVKPDDYLRFDQLVDTLSTYWLRWNTTPWAQSVSLGDA